MKILNRSGCALLAIVSLCSGLGSSWSFAQARGTKFVGEDQVQWEEKWYSLDDGAQKKLFVRRGSCPMGQWTQFRNDYEQPLTCQARVTSRLASGKDYVMLCFPDVAPAEIQVIPATEDEEITKVEISDLKFKPVVIRSKKATQTRWSNYAALV